MDRNRFIQCMKSNIELSDKERRRIIRRSVESQPWKSLSPFLILHQKSYKKLWTLNYKEKGINRDE